MRTRRAGLLDALIDKATDGGLQQELAALLDVSRYSVYKWNLGQAPSYEHRAQINALCDEVGLKPIYRLKVPRFKRNGRS